MRPLVTSWEPRHEPISAWHALTLEAKADAQTPPVNAWAPGESRRWTWKGASGDDRATPPGRLALRVGVERHYGLDSLGARATCGAQIASGDVVGRDRRRPTDRPPATRVR